MNRFELESNIRIKSTGKKGVVKGYKYETAFSYGKIRESRRYYIHVERQHFYWFDEDAIEYDETTFDTKFDIGFLDLMIDTYLLAGNYEMVKEYRDQKLQLQGGM